MDCSDNLQACIYCGGISSANDKLNHVGAVGACTLQEHALKLSLHDLSNEIEEKQKNNKKIIIHLSCRTTLKNSSRKRRGDEAEGPPGRKICLNRQSRSSTRGFNFKENCFYCEEQCLIDPKNPARKKFFEVRTLNK